MRPGFKFVLTAAAMTLSTVALVVAGAEVPSPAASFENAGGAVVSVEVLGSAWRDGIRAGQKVVSLTAGVDPASWVVTTTDGAVLRRSAVSAHVEDLRSSIPLAVFGLLTGFIALRLLRRDGPIGWGILAISGFASAEVLSVAPDPRLAIPGALLSLLIPALCLAVSWRSRLGVFVSRACFGVVVGIGVAWIASVTVRPEAFDAVDAARASVGVAIASGALAVTAKPVYAWSWLRTRRPTLVDAGLLAAFIAGLSFGAIVLALDPIVLAGLGLGSILAYPASRSLTVRLLDSALFSSVRRRAQADAVEEERARISRDIHDVPLQDLVGIIHRLDGLPAAQSEISHLRDLAEQLRDMAIGLHPSILEDAGLAPAIESLSTLRASREDTPVEVSLEDRTTHRAVDRPPVDVEVAIFRIVEQAIFNAIAHAQATSINVHGVVSLSAVELAVADNGCGLDPLRVRAAQENGHLGLRTMTERADAIGAELSLTTGAAGTSVRVRWTR
jgi:signal transduction histidine kinase